MITGNVNQAFKVVDELIAGARAYPSPLVIVPDKIMSPAVLFMKSFIDITGAIIGVVLMLPVIIVISVIIKISSKGPVIYSHERIGQFGKVFRIYKFRSMYREAEENGPQLTTKTDTRITPVGRFMRRWHLDEIPNFVNVLKGEMSLVGPRPERLHYINQIVKISPEYIKLLQVKPGVTSLGEVEFGYAENVAEMVARMKYDLEYIKNINIINDISILLRSINVVLKGKGV